MKNYLKVVLFLWIWVGVSWAPIYSRPSVSWVTATLSPNRTLYVLKAYIYASATVDQQIPILTSYDSEGSPNKEFNDGIVVLNDLPGKRVIPIDLAVHPDGSLILMGQIVSPRAHRGWDNNIFLLRVRPDGSYRTGDIILIPFSDQQSDSPTSVQVSTSGEIYVSAVRQPFDDERLFDPKPDELWVFKIGADGALDGGFHQKGVLKIPVSSLYFEELAPPKRDEAILSLYNMSIRQSKDLLISGLYVIDNGGGGGVEYYDPNFKQLVVQVPLDGGSHSILTNSLSVKNPMGNDEFPFSNLVLPNSLKLVMASRVPDDSMILFDHSLQADAVHTFGKLQRPTTLGTSKMNAAKSLKPQANDHFLLIGRPHPHQPSVQITQMDADSNVTHIITLPGIFKTKVDQEDDCARIFAGLPSH